MKDYVYILEKGHFIKSIQYFEGFIFNSWSTRRSQIWPRTQTIHL